MEKVTKFSRCLFIIISCLTLLEYVFVQGMFTWLIMFILLLISGIFDLAVEIKAGNIYTAFLVVLSMAVFAAGYSML